MYPDTALNIMSGLGGKPVKRVLRLSHAAVDW